ncbi:MAG: LacI family DNA-binding transcriptional regulator [Verrucomicrobiota bacterium]
MRTKAKISQQKIAKTLGVSQALVSLALNGRRESINPDTYKRIWDYAVSQGYTPKGMNFDQALAGARPRQIGFILRAPLKLYNASNFFSHVQHGLHVALESQGYSSTFLGSEETLTEQKITQFVRASNGCRGVVLLGQVSREFLLSLRKHTENIVAVSACYPGLCHSVQANEQQSLELLVAHLASLGHERIGWLGGNRGMIRHEQRFAAFKQALSDHGLPALEAHWSVQKEADRVEGAQAVREVLVNRTKADFPTAFISYNGMMARGAINALLQQQIAVPGRLSIAAVDSTRVMEEDEPHITSASASPEAMGEAAARLLIEDNRAGAGCFTDLVLPSTLTVRATTAAVAKKTRRG